MRFTYVFILLYMSDSLFINHLIYILFHWIKYKMCYKIKDKIQNNTLFFV